MKRTVLKVTGESGMGLLSVGRIIAKVLKGMGYHVHSDREYPSLIKGGHSNVQIDFGLDPIHSLSREADLVIALDRPGLLEYIDTVKKGGVLVHGFERHRHIDDLKERAKRRGIKLIYLPARTLAYSLGGTELMVNMVLLGLMWRVLGLPLKPLEKHIGQEFSDKPKLLEIDLQCVRKGYEAENLRIPEFKLPRPHRKPKALMLDGNMAITLGAIHAGVRAYFAYPMSPSSSILTYMANFARETGMLVRQAEDEITAAQMAVGAMHMGTRALLATSGGGFDLMTETFSMAGMTETPLVIVVAQRPGPATGLPTWSAQGDFDLAMRAGHGEYARVVIAGSDPESCYELIQHALNFAEEFQVPVVFLTEKTIAEAQTMVDFFSQKKIPIKRGLVMDKAALAKLESKDRFRFTKSGVSFRWIPGSAPVGYYVNSDEHREDGTLTEESEPVRLMVEKRLRKLSGLKSALPEPTVYGPAKADISFVGWGSSKNAVRDAMAAPKGKKINYLHYDFLYPLKTKVFEQFFKGNKNVHLIEGNCFGQFGRFLEGETGLKFRGKLLKYDGRPFFLEDVTSYIDQHA